MKKSLANIRPKNPLLSSKESSWPARLKAISSSTPSPVARPPVWQPFRCGVTASDRVARTSADKPIVAVLGRKRPDGRTLLALCGVAATPILVEPDQLSSLNPPADFRGSSEYRREMAVLLAGRVLNTLAIARNNHTED